jgi:hypothetical protein
MEDGTLGSEKEYPVLIVLHEYADKDKRVAKIIASYKKHLREIECLELKTFTFHSVLLKRHFNTLIKDAGFPLKIETRMLNHINAKQKRLLAQKRLDIQVNEFFAEFTHKLWMESNPVKTIVFIYHKFNDWFKEENYILPTAIIKKVDVDNTPIEILLGFLTACSWREEEISYYEKFRTLIERKIRKEYPTEVEKIMHGF